MSRWWAGSAAAANLSYRDVEELLAERGIEVDHVSVFRWVHRFTTLLADAARFARHAPGDRWFVDETYVKIGGSWRYVAVEQAGHRCVGDVERVRPDRGGPPSAEVATELSLPGDVVARVAARVG